MQYALRARVWVWGGALLRRCVDAVAALWPPQPDGDVADPATGLSPFPGNTNQLVTKIAAPNAEAPPYRPSSAP